MHSIAVLFELLKDQVLSLGMVLGGSQASHVHGLRLLELSLILLEVQSRLEVERRLLCADIASLNVLVNLSAISDQASILNPELCVVMTLLAGLVTHESWVLKYILNLAKQGLW